MFVQKTLSVIQMLSISFATLLTIPSLPAQLRITEVMSSSGSGGTEDWFELTNYGPTAVSLANYRVDDNSFSFSLSAALSGAITLGAGESAVFLEGGDSDDFRTFWGLGSLVQIGSYSGGGLGFSSGGDGTIIFDGAGTELPGPFDGFARVSFGAATTGSSFTWSYTADGQQGSRKNGFVSASGGAGIFQSISITPNFGSPGSAVVAASPLLTLSWSGGNGSWTPNGGTQWEGGPWDSSKIALFETGSGTVAVSGAVQAAGLEMKVDYTITGASGSSLETPTIDVVAGGTVTVTAELAGTSGLTKLGDGTLILSSAANSYSGTTSVVGGSLILGAADVLPGALAIARFLTVDAQSNPQTLTGLRGLGNYTMGTADLTISTVFGETNEFNGDLSGTGDLIIRGDGVQTLAATIQSIDDGATKAYFGATIVESGTLRVAADAVPSETSGVRVDAAGRLELSTDAGVYRFNEFGTIPIVLNGGTLAQELSDFVTLENQLQVVSGGILDVGTRDDLKGRLILSGGVLGDSALTLSGGGEAEFSGSGASMGVLIVKEGFAIMGWSQTFASVEVQAGGTLAGDGLVGGATTVAGRVAPGDPTNLFAPTHFGTLQIDGTLLLESSAVIELQLGGFSLELIDALTEITALTLDGQIVVSLVEGFAPTHGQQFDLLDWSGEVDASAFEITTDLVLPTLSDGLEWDTSSFLSNGSISVVPEPGSLVLLGVAAAFLAVRYWACARRASALPPPSA